MPAEERMRRAEQPREVDRRKLKVVAVACVASTVVVSPPFLVGALAVQIRADLGLTPGTLGLMSSVFFAVTALSSISLGRIVQDRGVRASLTVVLLVNAAALTMILSAPTLGWLALGMAVGGAANGAVHSAANALLAHGVKGRLGLALGLKQAAMPASTLAAGVAVPLIALTVGWRAVPGLVAASALVLLLSARRLDLSTAGGLDSPPAATAPPAFTRGVFTSLIVGAALGATASSTLGAFVVDSGVQMSGVGEAAAGLVIAAAGTVGMLTRIGFGWFVDGRQDRTPYVTSVWMLAFGACGFLLLASSNATWYVAGALLAYGAGWGWQGLLHFAVITRSRAGAARDTGRLLTGFASGSALGPLLLGQVAEHFGYAPMWYAAAGMAAAGAVVIGFTSRVLVTRGSG